MSSESGISQKTVWTIVGVVAATIVILVLALIVLFSGNSAPRNPVAEPTTTEQPVEPTQEPTTAPVPTETTAPEPTPTPTPTPTASDRPKVQPENSVPLEISQWGVTTWVPDSLGSLSYSIDSEGTITFTSASASALSCADSQSGWGWQRTDSEPSDGDAQKVGDFWYTQTTGASCSADGAAYDAVADDFETMFELIHE